MRLVVETTATRGRPAWLCTTWEQADAPAGRLTGGIRSRLSVARTAVQLADGDGIIHIQEHGFAIARSEVRREDDRRR